MCAPLNQLRYKDTPWKWSAECAAAFDELKQMLADKTRLVHFDPEKPIVLATDASPYGIGAVISHVLPDGSEEPIAFASKTLSKAERGYAQVEKEGLEVQQIATEVVSEFPITWKLVAECTKKDTVLSQVLNFVCNGWPTSGLEGRKDALRPFFNTQTEICQVNGVILRDCRVVVPQELQTKVITMLHQSHRGVVRMKTMARLYVWWPNIEASVEACCKACNCYNTGTNCQLVAMATARRAVGPHSRGFCWPILG